MSENKVYRSQSSSAKQAESLQVKQLLDDIEWSICLSGGGARGIAHLGVLQAFEESDLYPYALSGCSSGALVAALYAAGHKPTAIYEKIISTKWWTKIRLSGSFNGLIKTDAFVKPFLSLLPETFEDLNKPIFINTMDLAKGETVVFSQGELLPVLKASMAIPVVCKAVKWQHKHLFDGGLLNNLPIEPLLSKYPTVVGVHTNFVAPTSLLKLNSIRRIIERIFQLSIAKSAKEKEHSCAVWIEPKAVGSFRVFDFKKADQIFEIGYEYAKSMLKES